MPHILVLLGPALLLLNSCAILPRPTPVPVNQITAGNPGPDAVVDELIVILPGRWSLISELKREGMLDIAQQRWPGARIIVPDLHLGYYKNRTITQRLHHDIIQPAKKSGVTKIRLVGISLGGFGALIYDLEHPGEIDEILLLSPFLGDPEIIDEINDAGGLTQWQPGTPAAEDFSRQLWKSLRERQLQPQPRHRGNPSFLHPPRILLGCGTNDRLAPASRLFAQSFLPPEQQQWISAGTHDWPTWREILIKMPAHNDISTPIDHSSPTNLNY